MKYQNRKLTITVGICALNEQENIVLMLKSLMAQKLDSAVLEKILLISDGSTDETVARARSLENPYLEIREYSERAGLASRLNEQLKDCQSDILVINDADIAYVDPFALERIAAAFARDSRLMMACGHAQPRPSATFTEKAVRCTFDAYAPLKRLLNRGHNILSVHGCVSVFRKQFAHNLAIPPNVLGTDIFMYLSCRQSGLKYAYIPEAQVNFRLPQTLKDHLKQNQRQEAARNQLKILFPGRYESEYGFPQFGLARSLAAQFLRHPILCAYIFIVNKYCAYQASKTAADSQGKWDMIASTKKGV